MFNQAVGTHGAVITTCRKHAISMHQRLVNYAGLPDFVRVWVCPACEAERKAGYAADGGRTVSELELADKAVADARAAVEQANHRLGDALEAREKVYAKVSNANGR